VVFQSKAVGPGIIYTERKTKVGVRTCRDIGVGCSYKTGGMIIW
jgi:hypothetical protein